MKSIKKTICLSLIVLITTLSMAGCGNGKKPTINGSVRETPSLDHSYTSKALDLETQRFYAETADWLFYKDNHSNPIIINKSSKLSLKFLEEIAHGFILKDDWIYYRNSLDDYKLYRIKTDGSNRMKLCDYSAEVMALTKDYLYFTNTSDNKKLYRIKPDGSESKKICNDSINAICLSESNFIYYVNNTDNDKLYKMDMDGLEKEKINDSIVSSICYSDSYVYYLECEEKSGYHRLMKIGTNSTQPELVVEGPEYEFLNDLKASKDYLYFTSFDGVYSLYKVKKDGTSLKKLTSDNETIGNFDITEKGLIFSFTNFKEKNYKLYASDTSPVELYNFSPREVEYHENTIIYNDLENNLSLTKFSRSEPNKKIVLYRGETSNIKLSDNTIYFIAGKAGSTKLFSINIDGTSLKQHTKGSIISYCFDKDSIYYYDSIEKGIVMQKIDGSKMLPLCKLDSEVPSGKIATYDGYVYYNIGDSKISRVKTNGTVKDTYIEAPSYISGFIISESSIYYGNENSIIKKSLKTNNETVFFKDDTGQKQPIRISNDKLYYFQNIGGGTGKYEFSDGIFTVKAGGNESHKLLTETIINYDFADDDIYFVKPDRTNGIVTTNLDGASRKPVGN